MIQCNLLSQMYQQFVSEWLHQWVHFYLLLVKKENVMHCQIVKS